MKRLSFLMGVGVGFVLGSRAGRGPYERLETNVKKIAGQADVQDAAHQVHDVVQEKVNQTAGKISDALPNHDQNPSPSISH